jgi:hypothetical protein
MTWLQTVYSLVLLFQTDPLSSSMAMVVSDAWDAWAATL